METLYLVSLIVGGVFVLLSLWGGGEADAGADSDGAGGEGLLDLLSARALFLFAAFFGLTGVLLSWLGTEEPLAVILASLAGLVVGVGGNLVIQRVGHAHVSSSLASTDLLGVTAQVVVPFEGAERGKIALVARGQRLFLLARAFGGADAPERFQAGDEVVVVRLDGTTAEVVRPD